MNHVTCLSHIPLLQKRVNTEWSAHSLQQHRSMVTARERDEYMKKIRSLGGLKKGTKDGFSTLVEVWMQCKALECGVPMIEGRLIE